MTVDSDGEVTREQVRGNVHLSGRVKRYHTWPTLHEETVGAHCWGIMAIYVRVFGLPRAEVFNYILWHDTPELVSGDPPFPIKRDNPDLKEAYDRIEAKTVEDMGLVMYPLTASEKFLCKLCDLMQMWEFGIHELALGNRYALPIVEGTSQTVLDLIDGMPSGGLRESRRQKVVEFFKSRREIWDSL